MNDPKDSAKENIFSQETSLNESNVNSDESTENTPLKSRFENIISSAIKKTITHGIGALVNSEESIKSGVSDFRLHREIFQFITSQISVLKKEIITIIADESHTFLTRVNLSREIQKALSGLTIHVEAKIRLSDSDTNEAMQTNISVSKESHVTKAKKKKEEREIQK